MNARIAKKIMKKSTFSESGVWWMPARLYSPALRKTLSVLARAHTRRKAGPP